MICRPDFEDALHQTAPWIPVAEPTYKKVGIYTCTCCKHILGVIFLYTTCIISWCAAIQSVASASGAATAHNRITELDGGLTLKIIFMLLIRFSCL